MTSRQPAVPGREPSQTSALRGLYPGPAAADHAAHRRRVLAGPRGGSRAARLARLVSPGRGRDRGRAGDHPGRAAGRGAGPRAPAHRRLPRGPGARRAARRIVGLLLAAIPAVLLLAVPLQLRIRRRRSRWPTAPQPTVRPTLTRPPHPGHAFRLPLAGILYALLILDFIGGIVACVVLLRRRQTEHYVLPLRRSVGGRGAAQRAATTVSSGRRALAGLDDARAAITRLLRGHGAKPGRGRRGPRGRGHAR